MLLARIKEIDWVSDGNTQVYIRHVEKHRIMSQWKETDQPYEDIEIIHKYSQ